MKNQTIRDRYAALSALAQRVLPTTLALNKVSALLATRFHRPYHATEVARKQAIADHPTPEGWEHTHLPPAVADARQRAIDELMAQATPVKAIPDRMRLTETDLPRALRREGGDANVQGLAEIIVMLGSLYVPSAEERALDEATDVEEPDEPAPAAPIDDFAPIE